MKKFSKYGGRWLIGTVIIAVIAVIAVITMGGLNEGTELINMTKKNFGSYQGFIIIPGVAIWALYSIWYWKNIFSKNDPSDKEYRQGRTGIIAISVIVAAVLDVVAVIGKAKDVETMVVCIVVTVILHLIAAILAPVLMGSRK